MGYKDFVVKIELHKGSSDIIRREAAATRVKYFFKGAVIPLVVILSLLSNILYRK